MKTTQMTINGWIDTQTVMHSYNRVLFSYKRNEALIHASIWINLKNIGLNERSPHIV